MRTVAIIQARTGSTRLPGKVLLDLAGQPLLARVVERTRRAATLDEVAVATTDEPPDQAIADLCAARGWPCFRGSENDVLDRYYCAARQWKAETIVRITSDCPLIDPGILDEALAEFRRYQPETAYLSTDLPRPTFPRGLDVEVIRFDALETAWREARQTPCREHVTLYIYRHPERFGLRGMSAEADYTMHRWTVDTQEDYALACSIYEHFGHDRFTWRDVLAALNEHPEWSELNCHVEQKTV